MRSFAVLPLLYIVLVSLCGSSVPPPPSDVSGTVYIDANRNAIHDKCDRPAASVSVVAVQEDGARVTALTHDDGSFVLNDVAQGSALVTMDTDPDEVWPMTTRTEDGRGGSIVRVGSKSVSGIELGVTRRLPVSAETISVGGVIFFDENENGLIDRDECGIDGAAAFTESDDVRFRSVPGDGSFELTVRRVPEAVRMSVPGCGGDTSCEQWVPVGGGDQCMNVKPIATGDPNIYEANAAYARGRLPGAIRGLAFGDENGNGVQDGDESGLWGIAVEISQEERGDCGYFLGRWSVNTAGDGSYALDNLPPGTYRVQYHAWNHRAGTYLLSVPDYEGLTVDVGNTSSELPLPVAAIKGAFAIVIPYDDRNGDGIRQPNEETIGGLSACLADRPRPPGMPEGEPMVFNELACEEADPELQVEYPGAYIVGPMQGGGEYYLTIYDPGNTGLNVLPDPDLPITLAPAEYKTIELPIDRIAIEEQLLDGDPEARAVDLQVCYSDPDWVRRPFEEGYDPSATYYDAWHLDEEQARDIYDRPFVWSPPTRPDRYVWYAIAGLSPTQQLAACEAPLILPGAEVARAMTNNNVLEVVLRTGTNSGLTIVSIPGQFGLGHPQAPGYVIFVDESRTPLGRCGWQGCEY